MFAHANLQVQAYDELTHQFGEYTYFRISGSENPRTAVDFISRPANGNAAIRTTDLAGEVDTALGRVGADPFETTSVTIARPVSSRAVASSLRPSSGVSRSPATALSSNFAIIVIRCPAAGC